MVDPEGYVDINVFAYWLGGHPVFGKKAYEWIKKIEGAPRGTYVTSTLTIYQTLVIIAGLTGRNLKDKKLVEEIINSISSLLGLTITPLTPGDVTEAASLMKKYELDYEDALHLAAAIRSKAEKIISNDQDFDKTPLTRNFL